MTNNLADRAPQYRKLAAETRAVDDAMIHEKSRAGMLEAASVWDRLAEIAERQTNHGAHSTPSGRRRPHM
jgi:hypothetical protein